MRLHKNLCTSVVEALQKVFEQNLYTDAVIYETTKRNRKWGARDRRFFAEATYDIVRWYRLYKYLANIEDDHYWHLLGVWCIVNNIELPPWESFAALDQAQIQARTNEATMARQIRESVPTWLDEMGEKELGQQWAAEIKALNEPAKVVFRINTLKASLTQVLNRLKDNNIEAKPLAGYEQALVLDKRQNLTKHPLYLEGIIEPQDANSQLVAPFLRPESDHLVVDACAGAGGKALHLAALMRNKGKVLALDVSSTKLNILEERAKKCGASNIEPQTVTDTDDLTAMAGTADRLLLDVPCSGTGVIRRKPDTKWKLSADTLNTIKGLQQNILNRYCEVLKPGGLMVYATCSIFPSENKEQISAFLKTRTDYQLVEEKTLSPSQGFDGFYMALLEKSS